MQCQVKSAMAKARRASTSIPAGATGGKRGSKYGNPIGVELRWQQRSTLIGVTLLHCCIVYYPPVAPAATHIEALRASWFNKV